MRLVYVIGDTSSSLDFSTINLHDFHSLQDLGAPKYCVTTARIDQHFDQRVQCLLCGTALSRMETLRNHLRKIHPDSCLAKSADQLRKGSAFYFVVQPMRFNPETHTQHFPRDIRDHVRELYTARHEEMPSKDQTPGTIAESVKAGLTVPAVHTFGRSSSPPQGRRRSTSSPSRERGRREDPHGHTTPQRSRSRA